MVTKNAVVNGVNLVFDEVGTGPAVLLIHGFPLNRQMWRPQLATLVAAGYRVIAPDLRGFGDSDVPDGAYNMDLFADDLVLLLDHLAIEQAIVCGMSMGGYVLFNLLSHHPQRLAGAVCLVTRSTADDATGRERRYTMAREVGTYGPQAVADRFHPLMFAAGTVAERPKLAEEVYGWMVATASQGLIGGLLAMAERPDVTGLLPDISCPTLVIAGEHDQICPLELAQMIVHGLPRAQLCSVPEAGHLANLERPAQVNRCLLQFLRQIAPTELNTDAVLCDC